MIAKPSIFAILALASSFLLGEGTVHAEPLIASTKSGSEVKLRGYARWNNDCEPIDAPEIYVELAPKNGTICARVSRGTIRTIREGKAHQCVGRSIRGIDVVYFPRPGFGGTDITRYTVLFNKVRLTIDADIRVVTNPSSSEQERMDSPSEVTQSEGPIPVCAALVS